GAGGVADPTDSPRVAFPVDHERRKLERGPLRASARALVEQPGNPPSRVAAYECESRYVTLRVSDSLQHWPEIAFWLPQLLALSQRGLIGLPRTDIFERRSVALAL